jgi:hypothetical protein
MTLSLYEPYHVRRLNENIPSEDKIVDEAGELTIWLSLRHGGVFCLKFQSYLAFRKIPEAQAHSTLHRINRTAGVGWPVYTVSKSDFLEWYRHENAVAPGDKKITHYCVCTFESIIDVISGEVIVVPTEIAATR